mmetsp:Transcript_22412/g.76797  ORF Transcript_22412/g.76797 Transcript_22412/m.76797 type:complete len:284 (+) Transcript_22412:1752-2603(+)
MRSMWPLALTKLPSASPAVPSTPFQSRASNRMLIKSLACTWTCQASVKEEKNMASARNATMFPRCKMSALSRQLWSSALSSRFKPSARPMLSNMIGSVLRNWSVAPVKICFRKDTSCSVSARSPAPREESRHLNKPRTCGCTRINRRTDFTSATVDIARQATASVAPLDCIAAKRQEIVPLMCWTASPGSCSASSSSSSTRKRAARKQGMGPTTARRCRACGTASLCNCLALPAAPGIATSGARPFASALGSSGPSPSPSPHRRSWAKRTASPGPRKHWPRRS